MLLRRGQILNDKRYFPYLIHNLTSNSGTYVTVSGYYSYTIFNGTRTSASVIGSENIKNPYEKMIFKHWVLLKDYYASLAQQARTFYIYTSEDFGSTWTVQTSSSSGVTKTFDKPIKCNAIKHEYTGYTKTSGNNAGIITIRCGGYVPGKYVSYYKSIQ